MPHNKGGCLIDLTGQKFGEWTVLGRAPREFGTNGSAKWDCVCSCGNYGTVASQELRRGRSKSCIACAARKRGDAMKGRQGYYHLRKTPQEKKERPVRYCVDCSAPLSSTSMPDTVRCRSCAARTRQATRVRVVKPVKVKTVKVATPAVTRVVPETSIDIKTCLMCLRKYRGPGSYCKEECAERATR